MSKTLVEVDWVGTPLSVHDAIQSYLVEHPESYWLPPGRRWIYYLDRDLGLLQLVHDFTMMNDEEITAYLIGALEMFRGR